MARPDALTSAAVVLAAALSGCSLAPEHVTPKLSTPSTYPADVHASGSQDALAIDWTAFFEDADMRALIDLALRNNRDLRISVARILEAQGQYRVQRSDQLPKLDGSASATRNRVGSASTPTSKAANGGGATPDGTTYSDYTLGVGVSAFELDFWGRVRNLTDAARARYLSTVSAERAFRLSLIRDVATTYITHRSLSEQIDQAERTVAARARSLQIARLRLDAGVTSALDYRQSETLLTQALSELAALRNQRAQARDALQVLVGAPIEERTLASSRSLGEQGLRQNLDAGLPSALLTNRPDVIAAEENLRAARADVGAARAAFFPNIALTGQYGWASTSLDTLIGKRGEAWSVGPSLTLPIFDWGARRGNLSVAKARETLQVATYEKTVQTAFREVADALANRRYLEEQIAVQERAVAAQQALSTLAQQRYNNGVAQYLEVLDAQRSLFSAEQALIALRGSALNSQVTLYTALGGGIGPPAKSRPVDAAAASAMP